MYGVCVKNCTPRQQQQYNDKQARSMLCNGDHARRVLHSVLLIQQPLYNSLRLLSTPTCGLLKYLHAALYGWRAWWWPSLLPTNKRACGFVPYVPYVAKFVVTQDAVMN